MNPWVLGKAGRGVPEDLLAYIGLEMGMSLMKFNDIHKYWSSGCFWATIPSVQPCPGTDSNKFAIAFAFLHLACR